MDVKALLSTSVIVEELDYSVDKAYATLLMENKQDSVKYILKLKKNLNLEKLKQKISEIVQDSSQTHSNDIYHKYNIVSNFNEDYEFEVIYSEKMKYKWAKRYYELFQETPEIYFSKVKPYVESLPDVSFVLNILHNNTEPILYEAKDEFLIAKNYSFLKETEVYCLGFVYDKSIKSLRYLTADHLSLLKKMYDAKAEVAKIFKIDEKEIQCFIHYYPSYYHFHVHYASINLDHGSNKLNRAIDLFEVIQNIEAKHDYYQTRTLNLSINKSEDIYKVLFNS